MDDADIRKMLETLLDGSPLCVVDMWFDGAGSFSSCVPHALIGVAGDLAFQTLEGLERSDCGLASDFEGWARVYVRFELDPDPEWNCLTVDYIELLSATPCAKSEPIEDEPIPF